jgi:hypothetical protein
MLLYAPAILRSNAFQFDYTAYLCFFIVLGTIISLHGINRFSLQTLLRVYVGGGGGYTLGLERTENYAK